MRPLTTYLRSLDPLLPRQVWLVEAGGVVNSLGNRIVFPFIVIYLHNVRGISFAAAGFPPSAGPSGALRSGFWAPTIVDPFRARQTSPSSRSTPGASPPSSSPPLRGP